MDIDKLTLIAGADIPVPQLRVNIHQPTIREIAVIGEKRFYQYVSIFRINRESEIARIKSLIPKDMKENEDELVKSVIGELTDFEIFMQAITSPHDKHGIKNGVETILMLLMPEYTFTIEERFIFGSCKNREEPLIINEEGFKQLKEIIEIIFCLNAVRPEEFNVKDNEQAKEIAAKLLRAREKVRTSKGDISQDVYILANYISGLSIGAEAINLLHAMNFTIYQLFNQLERFGLKTQYDHGVSAMMAGAKDVEITDWMKSI